MTKHRLLVLAGLLAATFALPASAQFYAGGSLGRSHFTDVCSDGLTKCDDRDTAFNFFAGYQFGRYIGAEVGYRDFGHATLEPGGSVKSNAFELDAVGSLPLYRSFSVLGRVGVFHGKLKGEGKEERNNGGTFGAGVQYDFTPNSAVRVEWQRYLGLGGGDFNDKTDLEVFSFGVVMRFY